MHRSFQVTIAAFLMTVVVAACGMSATSSESPSSGGPRSSAPAGTSSAPTSMPSPTASAGSGAGPAFGEADDGTTVDLTVGDVATISLDSTYWQFLPSSDTSVVEPTSEPVYVRGQCAPGSGCGTATQSFRAVGPGRAVIRAERTSCGEALACAPDQAAYEITFVVR